MRRASWILTATSIAALAACGEGQPDQGESVVAEPAAAAPVIEIVGADYAFRAPDTLPAGLVTVRFRNEGREFHHVQLVQLLEGRTMGDFIQAMSAGGPPPAWAVFVGGPNAPGPDGASEVSLELEPGSYALICLIPSPDGVLHVAKGMMKALTVAGLASNAVAPEPDVVMTLKDYAFGLSAPLTAGRHLIRVQVEGNQPHEVLLVKLYPGKTVAELAAFAEKPEGPPPGEPIGGTTAVAPGRVNLVPVDLVPGEYGLICFVPDARDGKPHLVHGMMTQFTVM